MDPAPTPEKDRPMVLKPAGRWGGLVCEAGERVTCVAVGSDGKTPLERIRGRRGRDVISEIGEYVHYMPLRGDVDDKRQAKADMAPINTVALGSTRENKATERKIRPTKEGNTTTME